MGNQEQRRIILADMAKNANHRKSAIVGELDNFLSDLIEEYQSLLHQKDAEVTLLQEKLEDAKKETRELYTVKNDLLDSLEKHSLNTKKAFEALSQKDARLLALQEELDDYKKHINTLEDACDQSNGDLIRQVNALQQDLSLSESKSQEVLELKEKIAQLHTYIERGGLAYNKALMEMENKKSVKEKEEKKEE